MNTKPKAKKFRVRKSLGLAERTSPSGATNPEPAKGSGTGDSAPVAGKTGTQPDSKTAGAGSRTDAGSGSGQTATPPAPGNGVAKPSAPEPRTGDPTARQMRIARRMAARRGIKANTGAEAVEALRAQGIDPFGKNRLQIVPPKSPPVVADSGSAAGSVAVAPNVLPQIAKPPPVPVPSAPENAEDRRAAEIIRMQRNIAVRRRRNLIGLGARIFAFVAVPTIAAGFYYSAIATPMYATNSEFLIQQADAPAQSAVSGLLAGTSLANSQDSIAVQSYLQSREAMLRLDAALGFKAHFSDPGIDPLQRLDADGTNEAAYRRYQRSVRIGYDPTEGIVRMEVIAADPKVSHDFSVALIAYAEEQVDQLTQRIRHDQMAGATESYDDAELKMLNAQQRVLNLQEARGVLSAEAEVNSLMSQISTFEIQLKTQRLSLQSLQDNARPNQTKVDVAKRSIARLEALIAEMRAEMTQGTGGGASLARITGELVIAESELETRQMMFAQSLQQLETARIEANRQVRYLLQGVRPTAPDEAAYPRAFENTVLAFLIFSGLYLMLSLTASILREQVSA